MASIDRANRDHAGAHIGIAGPNTPRLVASAQAALDERGRLGIAGNLGAGSRRQALGELTRVEALHTRDGRQADLVAGGAALGDRAARVAWRSGCWFLDYSYVVAPIGASSARPTGVRWRTGCEQTFGRAARTLPVLLDSGGFRRVLSGTAPRWAHRLEAYVAAIEAVDPDGYAAFDDPTSRTASMAALNALVALFPREGSRGRLWPVFSVRWPSVGDPAQPVTRQQLPATWLRLPSLGALVPFNATQRRYSESAVDRWVRQAIAHAFRVAADPDFQAMAERFGQVMIGGLVRNTEIHRLARHVFAATLAALYPDVRLWLLGQATYPCVNGLGMLGLLDSTWLDGSWWLLDAMAERLAIVENGLITMLPVGRGKRPDGSYRAETFFTSMERMSANLRSLLAAKANLWQWPNISLPIDLRDAEQVAHLRDHLQIAQLELFG